jgi:phosphatidylinositol alpha-1,6-mannosyltransferase
MRLLLLTFDFPPAAGGVQQLLSKLAEGLAASHEVAVVTRHQPGDRAWDAGRRHRVLRTWATPSTRVDLVLLMLCALVEIARRPPDAIVCGHVLFGPLCRALRAVARIPYVAMAYAYEIRAPRMRRVAGWTLRGGAVVTISEFSRQAVLAHGVAPDQVVVIPPAAESRPATARPGEVAGRVLLSVSRLADRYKGHDMVLRALPLIRARIPDVRYVIVGSGWLRPYLERLAVSLGVRDAVTFVGDVSDEEVAAWYERCDVFVLASRESAASGGAEGYGIVFVEANLHGKPVIGGRSGGVPDAVRDGATGLLVNPLDAGEIADAVIRLMQDPALARRLGAEGRRRALEELSWPRYVEQFDRVLRGLVDGVAVVHA